MTRCHVLAAFLVLGVGYPATARAQALWGEPITTPGERFIVLESFNNEAVFDKETGLVWEVRPFLGSRGWESAKFLCLDKTTGGRMGWRLPSVEELLSIRDPVNVAFPALPAGHPFVDIRSNYYWSGTSGEIGHMVVNFAPVTAPAAQRPNSESVHVWCVRGGIGPH